MNKTLLGVLSSLILVIVAMMVLINVNLSNPIVQMQSCSNYPILEPGNIIIIDDTDFENIKEGETVIYEPASGEIPVAHQVTKKSENKLQTKGKNNPRSLPYEKNVTQSQIWGTPALILPYTSHEECISRE